VSVRPSGQVKQNAACPISNLLIAGSIVFVGSYDAISTALAGVSTEIPFDCARNAVLAMGFRLAGCACG
jgi:hypothetical protein